MSEKQQKPAQYNGRIDRGADGEIVGELKDQFGWSIQIHGIRDVEHGGYIITGRLGATPAAYRIPAIDGEGATNK